MKHSLLFLLVIFIAGCDEHILIKEANYSPSVWTFSPDKIDSTGATFRAIVQGYQISEVDSFGFFYGKTNVPYRNVEYCKITKYSDKDSELTQHSFQFRIDTLLAKEVNYYSRAFIKKDNEIIEGNTTYFRSKGSNHSKWSYHGDLEIPVPFSIYNEDHCFLITYDKGRLYELNPQNLELKEIRPSNPGYFGYNYIYCCSDDAIFMLSHGINQLYKYSIKENSWEEESLAPFQLPYGSSEYFQFSFFHNENAYFLNGIGAQKTVFNKYNTVSGEWTELENLRTAYIFACINSGDETYIITVERDIFKYNILSDSWEKVNTKYPGRLNYLYLDIINSYKHKNKLYFLFGPEHYEYDPIDNIWTKIEPLPNFFFHGVIYHKGKLICNYLTDLYTFEFNNF